MPSPPLTHSTRDARRSTHRRARSSAGFTLIELLIVVVILGILAAVVIPQFGNTSDSAKESALVANLQTIRQSIALYRVQHNEVYPGQSDWTEFVTQLSTTTHPDGTAGGALGPYIRTAFPMNPLLSRNTGKNVATTPAGPSGDQAYVYNPNNGELRANVAGSGPSGNLYWDL